MHLTTLFLIVMSIVLIGFTGYRLYSANNQTESDSTAQKTTKVDIQSVPFVFTTAGDFGFNDNSDKVLAKISDNGSEFTIALGDFGYRGAEGSEKQWCDSVLSRIGDEYPFELLVGNHDDGSKDGDLAKYIACLPNKLNDVSGDYGSEYYFDYNNLARFILISPDIDNYGYDYTKGTEHYDWVSTVIDGAHDRGLNWVILGMHKNCISPGVKSCEIGEDIMNLALEKKVNLILQGHEHGYFRSKQLSLNDNCPSLTLDSVNPSCIGGQGDYLISNNGTVIAISGAGGYPLRDVNLDDSEMDYFETWNGANVGNTYGFSRFTVSDESIKAEFVPVGNGQYTDSFTITQTAQ